MKCEAIEDFHSNNIWIRQITEASIKADLLRITYTLTCKPIQWILRRQANNILDRVEICCLEVIPSSSHGKASSYHNRGEEVRIHKKESVVWNEQKSKMNHQQILYRSVL